MCVRCIIRKTAQLYGIISRNRRESEEGGGHQTILTNPDLKRNPEADMHDGSTQPIHIQVGRTWYAFLQAAVQRRLLPVG
jgi:hypothetical protein